MRPVSEPVSARREPPHDILAAEEFVMPGPDPDLRSPLRLPDDPTGMLEPHDILAAEEFPMPAVDHLPAADRTSSRRLRGLAGGGLLALVLFSWSRRAR